MKQKLQIITNIFILTVLVMGLVVLPLNSIGQPVLKIGNYYGCSSIEVLIPVELENFEDISAFTIYVGVDTSNIEYIGFENINEVFSSGNFVGGVNLQNQYITFNWASLTPISIESGVMCNIRILLKNNSVDLSFLDICEVVRSDLSIIDNVDYYNGSVTSMNSIEPMPSYQSLIEDSQATIELVGLSSDISCHWQINSDNQWVDIDDAAPYSGVNTFSLFIQSVSIDMNNTLFRGMLSNDICSGGSVVSELVVTTSNLDEQIMVSPIQVYPNPADEYLNCVFNKNIQNAELKLISLGGRILFKQNLRNIISGQLFSMNIENIESGHYILNLYDNGILISNIKVAIM